MNGTKNHLRRQEGNTVVSVLASIVVVGAFLQTTGFGNISDSNMLMSKARAREGRNTIAYQIERYASLPVTFRNSLRSDENSDLRNCVLGTVPASCIHNREYPVRLFSPSISAGAVMLSGAGGIESSLPVFYDVKGNPCGGSLTSATETCPFEVVTTFTPVCSAAATTCVTAESIKISYSVSTPLNTKAGSFGKFVLAKVAKEAHPVMVQDILPHDHTYVPGKLQTGTKIVSGVTEIKDTQSGYIKVYQIVMEMLKDPIEAAKIANILHNLNGLTDPAQIKAITRIWIQNEAVARGLAGRAMQYGIWGKDFSVTDIETIGSTLVHGFDGWEAQHLAAAGINTIERATAISNAIGNNKDELGLVARVTLQQLTDPVMVGNMAIIAREFSLGDATAIAPFAQWVGDNKITDLNQMRNWAKDHPYVESVASNPATPATPEPIIPSTTGTVPVAGSFTSTCTSAAACGNVPGI